MQRLRQIPIADQTLSNYIHGGGRVILLDRNRFFIFFLKVNTVPLRFISSGNEFQTLAMKILKDFLCIAE